jgi:hypothetical protein
VSYLTAILQLSKRGLARLLVLKQADPKDQPGMQEQTLCVQVIISILKRRVCAFQDK